MRKSIWHGIILAVALVLTGTAWAAPFDAEPVFTTDYNDPIDTMAFDIGKPNNDGAVAIANDGPPGDSWRCFNADIGAGSSGWYMAYTDRYIRRVVVTMNWPDHPLPAKVPI